MGAERCVPHEQTVGAGAFGLLSARNQTLRERRLSVHILAGAALSDLATLVQKMPRHCLGVVRGLDLVLGVLDLVLLDDLSGREQTLDGLQLLARRNGIGLGNGTLFSTRKLAAMSHFLETRIFAMILIVLFSGESSAVLGGGESGKGTPL